MSPWLQRWLYTTYHKDIGLLYLAGSMYFGFIGAILILLVRVQLAIPTCAPGTTGLCWPSSSSTFLSPAAFNQAVTLHGLIMILWFLSPLAIGLANYFLPLQIGAQTWPSLGSTPSAIGCGSSADCSRPSGSSSLVGTPPVAGPRTLPSPRASSCPGQALRSPSPASSCSPPQSPWAASTYC